MRARFMAKDHTGTLVVIVYIDEIAFITARGKRGMTCTMRNGDKVTVPTTPQQFSEAMEEVERGPA